MEEPLATFKLSASSLAGASGVVSATLSALASSALALAFSFSGLLSSTPSDVLGTVASAGALTAVVFVDLPLAGRDAFTVGLAVFAAGFFLVDFARPFPFLATSLPSSTVV